MDKLQIEGGYPLKGEVAVSKAKNAVLPLMAATLLADGPCLLKDVPRLQDVDTLLDILRDLGVAGERQNGDLELAVADRDSCTAPYDKVRKMRGSFLVLGPLLARRGQARVSLPGGCVIGVRPTDLHLKGLAALGARLEVAEGYIEARARKLRGAEIYLGGAAGSTVTGTANVLMAATLAEGQTVIENAACEPEVVDLADFLNKLGAQVAGAGTPTITVQGVSGLSGATHTPIPDRIEAGTLLVAGAITRGELTVRGACPAHLGAVIDALRRCGVEVQARGKDLAVRAPGRLNPADLTTLPYPGFPTDLQAQFTALLCLAEGISVVTERIFPDRFMHVAELNRMGAQIRKEGASAVIGGAGKLTGAPVMASDLRASAALVLAGMAARGTTEVARIYHLDRGYDALDEKLARLGAAIKRIA